MICKIKLNTTKSKIEIKRAFYNKLFLLTWRFQHWWIDGLILWHRLQVLQFFERRKRPDVKTIDFVNRLIQFWSFGCPLIRSRLFTKMNKNNLKCFQTNHIAYGIPPGRRDMRERFLILRLDSSWSFCWIEENVWMGIKGGGDEES